MTADPAPLPTATISEGKKWLRRQVRGGRGGTCPVCNRIAKIRRRPITSTMARSLIKLYQGAPFGSFVHWGRLIGRQYSDEAKLAHWGLVEEERRTREDGGRAGYWRITQAGVDWIEGRSTVTQTGLFFNARCLGLEGPQITIADALGKRFNLAEVLAGG